MEKILYLVGVHQGVEPFVRGPFQVEARRNVAARRIHKKQRADDSLFWADVDESGDLTVGSYVAGFFWKEYINQGTTI